MAGTTLNAEFLSVLGTDVAGGIGDDLYSHESQPSTCPEYTRRALRLAPPTA